MVKSTSINKMTHLSLLCAISIILGYIESLIPFQLGIPGAKIGLANIITIITLLCFGFQEAFLIMILRVFIIGITFTNLYMMMYSLSGGILSLIMMYIFYRTQHFSNYIISIIGGIFHNIGQLIVAMIFFNSTTLAYYLPYLLLLGLISGTIIGIISQIIFTKIGSYIKRR